MGIVPIHENFLITLLIILIIILLLFLPLSVLRRHCCWIYLPKQIKLNVIIIPIVGSFSIIITLYYLFFSNFYEPFTFYCGVLSLLIIIMGIVSLIYKFINWLRNFKNETLEIINYANERSEQITGLFEKQV